MPHRVSVVLPYHQAEATLEEAVASVLAQRGVDLELLAVDDRSTDGGPARVAAIATRDPRVRPLRSAGRGIVAALSAGVAAARGELLARMDGDDVCLPGRLAAQVALMASDPGLGAVGTQVEAFPDAAVGEGLRRYVAWQNGLITPADHAREIFVEAPLCHPSVMLRRDALARVGGFRDVPWPEDYDLWLRLDAAGYGLAKVPQVLLRWRHREGRATFSDPRYGLERFREAKAEHLCARLGRMGRELAVWGAGPTGRRLARALEPFGVRAACFVDIDPRKLGRTARAAPIVAPDALSRERHAVVVAVGARGARALIRAALAERGFREGADYLCAA
jgi:glycosyltransferase involved in cell wall biosynthesis